MGHVGVHQVDVLVVLPGEHRVLPVDHPGEEGEPLVPDLRPVQGAHLEVEEVLGLEHLRQGHPAVVGGVGGVVADPAVVVGEPDEPGVLDPVGLGGRRREDDPFRDVQLGAEADLVVGLGQHEHGVGDRLELALAGPVVPQDVPERVLQVVERELVAQRGHHLLGQRAVDPQFGQLAVEEGLLVEGVGHQVRGRDEPGRLVHADPVLGVDHAGAEGDRRDVPLAGGPQAEDEPAGPVGQARLVGVPDHRGVEQGRRFQGVFLGEVGADQQAPALADRLVGQQVARGPARSGAGRTRGSAGAARGTPASPPPAGARPPARRGTRRGR